VGEVRELGEQVKEDQAGVILAEARRQRVRAMRQVAVPAVLATALLVATAVAAVSGHYHGPIVILVPVLLVLNLMRLGQCALALRKIRNAERLVRDARERWPGR